MKYIFVSIHNLYFDQIIYLCLAVWHPVSLANHIHASCCVLTTDFLASPFYRISGLITALGEVGDSSTETLAVSAAVTSRDTSQ